MATFIELEAVNRLCITTMISVDRERDGMSSGLLVMRCGQNYADDTGEGEHMEIALNEQQAISLACALLSAVNKQWQVSA